MNYKPSDVMAVVQAVKKLGWNFTHANETFDGDRCNLNVSFYKLEKNTEAWREDYRKKQAAGVRFENYDGSFWWGMWCTFNGNKEDYREVPQESPKVKGIGAGIPEASEIRKWADRYYSLWCFVENSLPRDASSDTFDIFRGYARQVNDEIYGVTDKAKEPHAAERALWKAQREAGTNEVWQVVHNSQLNVASWMDIVDKEPQWLDGYLYRVKPMKLTARICRVGKTYPMSYIGQDWEFTGTREEYRAECEKYGYVVVSEIKEVVEKPKMVKYYMAMAQHNTDTGIITSFSSHDKNNLQHKIKSCGYTIIGDIEEREV